MFLPIILEGWKTALQKRKNTDYREDKNYLIIKLLSSESQRSPKAWVPSVRAGVSLSPGLTCKKKYKRGYLNEASHLMKN